MKELEFGVFADPLAEQLKEFNIPAEQVEKWEVIKYFILSANIHDVATDRQADNLFKYLAKHISDYIVEESKDNEQR